MGGIQREIPSTSKSHYWCPKQPYWICSQYNYPCPYNHNYGFLQVDTINLEDEKNYLQNAVHFGVSYRHDQKIVWNLFANALLDKPG